MASYDNIAKAYRSYCECEFDTLDAMLQFERMEFIEMARGLNYTINTEHLEEFIELLNLWK